MINLIIGIALGAVFSKFWLALWESFWASTLGKQIKSWFGQ